MSIYNDWLTAAAQPEASPYRSRGRSTGRGETSRRAVALLALGLCACAPAAHAVGFSEADVLFYGEVRQVGGAHAVLRQAGHLEMTFVNRNDAANRVTVATEMAPTGIGATKPFSYALRVPLMYLPVAEEKDGALAIGAADVDFRIENITIDGIPATLPDGSKEFFSLSFASRGDQYRLDLLIQGDSADTDGDELPDWWESLHGLDPDTPDAGADPDGDGWSNIEEYVRGSDPNVSNRDPQLATTEALIPETGEAGLLLQFLDSDTPANQLAIALTVAADTGFQVKLDGAPVAGGAPLNLTLADLEAGRVSVLHSNVAVRSLALPLSWNDGSTGSTGIVSLRVALASAEDGSDSGFWLDGNTLTGEGSAIALWADRSGGGRPAGQPLPDNQPIVALEGLKTTASFAASNAYLFFQDVTLPASNQTVLAAYRTSASADETQTLMACNRGFLQLAPTTKAISYPGVPLYQVDSIAVRGHEPVLGATTLSIFRRDGAALQNIFGLSFNGEAASPETLEPVLPTLGARRMALPGPDPVRENFNGQLHELMIFPRALQEQKLRDVHDYLLSKWDDAVIWDLSTTLPSLSLVAGGSRRHIIRGGWGADVLGGGAGDDIISGGAGADTLTGGPGADSFVYGGVDIGNDLVTDFDSSVDTLDLSALYWGLSGDARAYISVRLDVDFSGGFPTLNSALIVQRPAGGSQEIVLRDVILGAPQLNQLIVEGRIRMGSLSIPTEVQLALTGGDPMAMGESTDDRLTFEITRQGDGAAGAMEIPLGFFEEALGRRLILEGAVTKQGQRAVVAFAPGETSKSLTFRPMPDLKTQGPQSWEVAILPHFRFSVVGGGINGVVTDVPRVWLTVLETNALTSIAQSAQVRIFRDGPLDAALSVDLALTGTAVEGVHIDGVPRTVLIPATAAYVDLSITPDATWDGFPSRVIHLAAAPRTTYQLGDPYEAILYTADTAANATASGFGQWLATATEGNVSTFAQLLALHGRQGANAFIRAYAAGAASPDDLEGERLTLRLANGRPELCTPWSSRAAEVRWGVRFSSDLRAWSDASPQFAGTVAGPELRLLGQPLAADASHGFYRLALNLDVNPPVATTISSLTGGSTFGVEGTTSWSVDANTGALVSGANASGEFSRLVVEIDTPAAINFEMAVEGGVGNGRLAFYIDGVLQAETTGDPVVVSRQLSGTGTSLLMWESTIESGEAVIRDVL